MDGQYLRTIQLQGVNVDANKKNDFSVTATLENGMSATCSIVVVPPAP